jgi:hypothetical protein
MKTLTTCGAALILVLTPLVSTRASIIPAPEALTGLVNNYRTLNLFSLTLATRLADGRRGTEEVTVMAPDRFRAVLRLPDGAQVKIKDRARAVVVWRGRRAARRLSPLTAYLAPFMCRTRAQALAMLKRFKIRPLSLGLELVSPYIAVMIGATAQNPSAPQLWLDKDHYFPLRLVIPTDNPQVALTVHYRDYSRQWGWWLPRRIEIRLGSRVLRQMEVKAVAQLTRTPAGIFDAERLSENLSGLGDRNAPPLWPDDFERLLREYQERLQQIQPR